MQQKKMQLIRLTNWCDTSIHETNGPYNQIQWCNQ